MSKKLRTAILGASGYTGAELLRLLPGHPVFEIAALTGDSQAGKAMAEVYPHLRAVGLPKLVKHAEVDFSQIDFVFCCLPHGTTQEIIAGLPEHVRIVDLSADFRLFDTAAYAEWYGHAHRAAPLQKQAVYGLTEHARDAVKKARLVANPGCYPTCALLPLLPLVERGMIAPDCITINALSGISGAGRSAKQEMLFTELDGGVSAYGIGKHRHMAEIEQEINRAAASAYPKIKGKPGIRVDFTPHLVPLTRGMLATITVQEPLGEVPPLEQVHGYLCDYYDGEPFVQVVPLGTQVSTHQVRGTNQCFIALHPARNSYFTIVSVIDNLGKGAAGQALQNANLMAGVPETTNLELTAIFP